MMSLQICSCVFLSVNRSDFWTTLELFNVIFQTYRTPEQYIGRVMPDILNSVGCQLIRCCNWQKKAAWYSPRGVSTLTISAVQNVAHSVLCTELAHLVAVGRQRHQRFRRCVLLRLHPGCLVDHPCTELGNATPRANLRSLRVASTSSFDSNVTLDCTHASTTYLNLIRNSYDQVALGL